jgi:hypothetical protein
MYRSSDSGPDVQDGCGVGAEALAGGGTTAGGTDGVEDGVEDGDGDPATGVGAPPESC